MEGPDDGAGRPDERSGRGALALLVAAGRWLLDTFRGHASLRELRDRER